MKVLSFFRWLMCCALVFLYSCKGDEETEDELHSPTPYNMVIPQGFPQMNIPAGNPLTEEGIELGRRLFYDNILSGNHTLSCAGCHRQENAFSDRGNRFSKGIDGIEGSRNSQALVNMGFNLHFFWDGRAPSLEEQAFDPVRNPIELNLSWPAALSRLQSHSTYPELFKKAFNTDRIDSTHVVKALAQFTRTLISSNSRFDRRARNEINLTPSELNGYVIFNTEKGDCFHCHSLEGGRLLTDNQFHNNGIDSEFPDPGYAAVTGKASDMGKFLTPTLRNIAVTAPYMHDGRFATLEEVIEHYNSGGKPSPTIDPLMKNVGTGLNLTSQEKADLIAFLRALTDSTFLTNPKFSSPF